MAAIPLAADQKHGLSAGAGRLHLGYLDGIRAIAALVVVISHLWNLYTNALPLPGITGFLTNWLESGHLWVNVFIVISGFCLMLPVTRSRELRGGWQTFYKNRARRILPPLYAVIGLAMLRSVLHHEHLSIGAIFSNVFLLQDVWQAKPLLDGPLWSVALEWKIYFLFPFFVWLWLRFGSRAVLVTSGVLGGVLLAFYSALQLVPDMSLASPWYVFLFALGMVSADFARRDKISPASELIAWLILIVALALNWVQAHFWPVLPEASFWAIVRLPIGDSLAGLAAAALFFLLTRCAAAQKGSPPQKQNSILFLLLWILSARPLVFLGTFSYSIYLTHSLLVYDISGYLTRLLHTQTALILIPIDIAIFLPIAYVFHLIIERPFMSKPAPKTEAQAEAAAVASPAP